MQHPYRAAAILVSLVLAGCGGAPPARAPVVPTEAATSAPQPTSVPTPTPFQAILDSDTGLPPGAVVNGQQLGLGAEFVQICRQCTLTAKFPAELQFAAGFQELRDSTHPEAVIPWFKFPRLDNFAFANDDGTEFIEGFRVALKDADRQAGFDDLLIAQFLPRMQETLHAWTPTVVEIEDVMVGEDSIGVTAAPTIGGFTWRFGAVSFRRGEVGGFVFTLYPDAAAPPPVDVVKLAQRYADSKQ